jgi:hypothetical protein
MVFGLNLFGGGSRRSSASSSAASSSAASSPATSAVAPGPPGAPGGALTSADSLPPAAAVCPPLTAVPPAVVARVPGLALSVYNLTQPERCANVLALAHNATRLEMADMEADVMPAVVGMGGRLGEEEVLDLKAWWAGFARFVCTTSLVTDLVVERAFGDVFVGFRKETRGVAKLHAKVHERNNVTLELAVKRMARAVEALDDAVGGRGVARGDVDGAVQAMQAAWGVLLGMLVDIYGMAEDLVAQIDRFGSEPLEYKGLEMEAARVYTKKKRWGERDEAKRGELIVVLTRWMGDEAFMRNWMASYLGKQDLKRANGWMNEYRALRLVIVDRFHAKRIAIEGKGGSDGGGGEVSAGAGGVEFVQTSVGGMAT